MLPFKTASIDEVMGTLQKVTGEFRNADAKQTKAYWDINAKLGLHRNPIDYEFAIQPHVETFAKSWTPKGHSGSIVAVSSKWILKEEPNQFFTNFSAVVDQYMIRLGDPNGSCLQVIRAVFACEGKTWFLIENSNPNIANVQVWFDVKASRILSPKKGDYVGQHKAMGFTDDIFYMIATQEWVFSDAAAIANLQTRMKQDLDMLAAAWSEVELVDYSVLAFVNKFDPSVDQVSPNGVRFTRKNPKTGEQEECELVVSVIDFLAHLNFWKNYFGQQKKDIKAVKGKMRVKDGKVQGEGKFTKDYAKYLNQVFEFIFQDVATLESDPKFRVIMLGYVAQARARHQQFAIDFFTKNYLANELHLSAVRDAYYRKCPHGLPQQVLKRILMILSFLNIRQNWISHRDLRAVFKEPSKFMRSRDDMLADLRVKLASVGNYELTKYVARLEGVYNALNEKKIEYEAHGWYRRLSRQEKSTVSDKVQAYKDHMERMHTQFVTEQ
jgi:hypothetical protein